MEFFKNQGKLKSLGPCVSPLSASIIACACFVPQIFLLQPTVLEFLAMFIVDTLVFTLYLHFDQWFFTRLFPDTAIYFKGLDDARVQKMSLEERISLYHSFQKYPKRRAIYTH